jgi:ABC-type Zn uptake system ZnuABC Zn-binding protein ZnuA
MQLVCPVKRLAMSDENGGCVDMKEISMVRSRPMPTVPFITIGWLLFASACVTALSTVAGSATQPLNVVVTIPVLKDLAEQVGGPYVQVTTLLKGYENEHTYSPKPSDLIAVRNAQLLFQVGLGLEVWVSGLVKSAGRPSLAIVTTSKGIALISDGREADPMHQGHAGGNPHVWMDPENVATMMRHVTEALVQADAAHAEDFRRNQAAYLQRLDHLRAELTDRLGKVSDRRFIAHHPAWPYFARRFGFEIVGTIQAQSASEPSAVHIQSLIATIRKHRVKAVVSEIQLSQRLPELLARETGARVVVLTTLPGGLPRTDTYLDMLRYNVLQLANALEAP